MPQIETNTQMSAEILLKENKRLHRAVEELSVLNELARTIGMAPSFQDVIDEIISRSMRAVNAEQASITLIDRETHSEMKTLVRAIRSDSYQEDIHLSQVLLGSVLKNKKPLRSNDPAADGHLAAWDWHSEIRSIICVPLLAKSVMIGVLAVYNNKDENGFTDIDQRLLGIIAIQSAQVIENARLHEEEKTLLKIREQLQLAEQIQKQLLPKNSPVIPGYEVAGHSEAAQEVGGDYFDFIDVDSDHWILCLGDVSGKGLPASLLMANLQATLRAQVDPGKSVCSRVTSANQLLFHNTMPEKFVTLYYAQLDLSTNRLCYCSGGHEPSVLFKGKPEPIRLTTGGMLLGINESAPFEEEFIEMAPGDVVITYSDGVTDAENLKGEQFGEERLIPLLLRHYNSSPQEIIDAVLEAIGAYTETAKQFDDISIMVLKRKP